MDQPTIWVELKEYASKEKVSIDHARENALEEKQHQGKTYIKVRMNNTNQDATAKPQRNRESQARPAFLSEREVPPANQRQSHPNPSPAVIDWPKSISVKVTDINISFTQMVSLMVKGAFAAIPAIIIITTILFGLVFLLSIISKSIQGILFNLAG